MEAPNASPFPGKDLILYHMPKEKAQDLTMIGCGNLPVKAENHRLILTSPFIGDMAYFGLSPEEKPRLVPLMSPEEVAKARSVDGMRSLVQLHTLDWLFASCGKPSDYVSKTVQLPYVMDGSYANLVDWASPIGQVYLATFQRLNEGGALVDSIHSTMFSLNSFDIAYKILDPEQAKTVIAMPTASANAVG